MTGQSYSKYLMEPVGHYGMQIPIKLPPQVHLSWKPNDYFKTLYSHTDLQEAVCWERAILAAISLIAPAPSFPFDDDKWAANESYFCMACRIWIIHTLTIPKWAEKM
jgi:hypothetical protein